MFSLAATTSKRFALMFLMASLMSGCTSTAQQNYDNARFYCGRGNAYACRDLPKLSDRARAERQNNNTNAALGAGAVALGALAVGALAAAEHEDRKQQHSHRHDRRYRYHHGYYRDHPQRYRDGW